MRFRLAFWKLEAKMLGLVLVEALTICIVLTFLVAEVAGYWTFMFRGTMSTFVKILAAAACSAFLIALYRNLWSVPEDEADEPLRVRLSSLPELEACVREVGADFKQRMPKSVAILLSPVVWRRYGRDAARLRDQGEFCLPVSLLAIWPIVSLRCHIAHTLIRRRPRKWLFYAVRKSLIRLTRGDRVQLLRKSITKP